MATEAKGTAKGKAASTATAKKAGTAKAKDTAKTASKTASKDGSKGTTGRGRKGKKGGRTTESPRAVSNRYTPPIPKNAKSSPKWMGILIIALFLLGVLIVILNYAGVLPGGVNNLWLIAAIASIFAGLITATRYH
jgi:cobalamin biosynthesis Mg chelatase CobN